MQNNVSTNCSSPELCHVVLKTLPAHPLLPIAAAGVYETMKHVFVLMGYLQPPRSCSWQLLDAGTRQVKPLLWARIQVHVPRAQGNTATLLEGGKQKSQHEWL